MNSKPNLSFLITVAVLLCIATVFSGCSKSQHTIVLDLGYNTHPIVGRGIFYDKATQSYQLYFINNQAENPLVYFFDLAGNKTDSLTINFHLQKSPNNIKFISKDSILYTLSREDLNQFYLINPKGDVLQSRDLKPLISKMGDEHDYYLVPFRNNCYTHFSLQQFTTTILFSPNQDYTEAHAHLSEVERQKALRTLEKKSFVLLVVQHLFTAPRIKMRPGLFDEKKSIISKTLLVDLAHSFYAYSPFSRVIYELDYNMNILSQTQIISEEQLIAGEDKKEDNQKVSYIDNIVYDKNTQDFFVIISIDNDVYSYNVSQLPVSSFMVKHYDKHFNLLGSKIFDGEEYNINSVLLANNKLFVEKRNETFGQLTYEIHTEI
ncbi:hypothetical protein [Myroides sp. WP-1]|uniref:hypothetical protein n=1 Tax=Myroides sp. WP-1 TaxID=2759944 RepID=UPI0015F8A259|nr:hypothetical protein [Myroides sp. WP-1]MBB1140552.1 hypothetical protein [Myroides sp. WP-1]